MSVTVSTDPNEREILETFIDSAAWKWLLTHFEAEWGRAGARYLDLLEKMANAPASEQAQVTADLQKVVFVRKELEGFFRGVQERLAALTAAERRPETPQSRRGYL